MIAGWSISVDLLDKGYYQEAVTMRLETKYLSKFPVSPGRVQSSQLCLSVIRNKLTSFQQEIAEGSRSCGVFVKVVVAIRVRYHNCRS